MSKFFAAAKTNFDLVFDRLLAPDAELQELFAVLVGISWGSAILIYEFILNSPSLATSIVFKKLLLYASGEFWGLLLFGLGLTGLVAYIINNVRLRRICLMFKILIWSLMSYFVFVDFIPVFGSLAIPLIVIFSMLSFIRLGYKPCPRSCAR